MARKFRYPCPVTSKRLGLRERKKIATRHAIGLAAVKLAIEHGLENVLVEDIAEAAGVSPRTFNNYFSSKSEAICSIASGRARLIGAELRERPASEPLWEAITHAMVSHHQSTEPPDPAWIKGVRLVTSEPALQGEFLKTRHVMQESLADAIRDRIGAEDEHDMFCWIMAGAIVSISDIAIDRWLSSDPPVALTPLLHKALDEFADGMLAALPDRHRLSTEDIQGDTDD